MAVATMAQLTLFSSVIEDFKLEAPNDKKGFEFVKYQNSFKTSLMQAGNEGYDAFNTAHLAMDDIRITTLSIPKYMKNINTILSKNDEESMKVFLPKVLKNIETVAKTCHERSGDVENKYSAVSNLLKELSEAARYTMAKTEEEKEKIKKEKNIKDIEKEEAERMKKEAEKVVREKKETEKKREQEFQEAREDSSYLLKRWFCNASQKLKVSTDMLNHAMADSNKKSDELMEKNKALNECLMEISTLDLTAVSIEKVMSTLQKGLDLLTQLQQKWREISEFFQTMMQLIKSALEPINNVKEIANGAEAGDAELIKELLADDISVAIALGSIVNQLSGAYLRVSTNYLMGPMRRLSSLQMITDKGEIERERIAVMEECKKAQGAIEELVNQEKTSRQVSLQRQITSIHHKL
jgi:hypothetical protein